MPHPFIKIAFLHKLHVDFTPGSTFMKGFFSSQLMHFTGFLIIGLKGSRKGNSTLVNLAQVKESSHTEFSHIVYNKI